jgi:hypothetical protein
VAYLSSYVPADFKPLQRLSGVIFANSGSLYFSYHTYIYRRARKTLTWGGAFSIPSR